MEKPNQSLATSSPTSREASTGKEERFSGLMTHQQAELAAIAVASAAKAEIEASYILALKNPRKEEESRRRILDLCQNLKFAEGARYSKPQGKKQVNGQWIPNLIVGPSIRFAEEAIRLWRNIKTLQTTIYDDPLKRIVKITVIDLESNISYSKEFVIEKTVERKDGKYREILAERMNSMNERVFIVVATEDEIANKEASLASKTIRNNGLRMIPDYVINEAMEIIEATVKSGVDKDPKAASRKVIDNFAKINISLTKLEEYLKHPVDEMSPNETVDLKNIFISISEGHSTWAEVMEGKAAEPKTAEVVDAGMNKLERLPNESDEAYEQRVIDSNWGDTKAGADKKGFKAGDASTHKPVNQKV